MRRIKRFRAFIRNNRTVFGCLFGALLLDIVIELCTGRAFPPSGRIFRRGRSPFFVNALILTLCLSLCMFAKRKWFWAVLIGAVWAGLGIANMYVLSYRVSPLSAIDFAILQLDWSFIGIYMSVPVFILLVAAVLLLIAGLVLLYRRSPKSPVQPRRSIVTICILLLSVALLPELPLAAGFAGNAYTGVITLTERYGFVHIVSQQPHRRRHRPAGGLLGPPDPRDRRGRAQDGDENAGGDAEHHLPAARVVLRRQPSGVA